VPEAIRIKLCFALLFAMIGLCSAAQGHARVGQGNVAKSCYLDSDGDGLANCVEDDTGVFRSASRTGTDPYVIDTDDDGISDGDEVNGTAGGLDLPAMGVSPLHKDILLEYDWFNDAECGIAHSHRPTVEMLALVRDVFANAPIGNPDGKTGIRVYQDGSEGELGLDSGSNLIAGAAAVGNGYLEGGIDGDEYLSIEADNFRINRRGYFHYVVFAHGYTGAPGSSGQASIGGHRMLVTLGCGYSYSHFVANTIVHELGHNLGLLHGGDENCNRKPNYNSVMNYRFQFPGVVDCSLHPFGRADYSYGTRVTLIENALIESVGVCQASTTRNGPAIDWNVNHVIDTAPVSHDVNFYPASECPGMTELHDFDDWGHVQLAGLRIPNSMASEPCTPAPD
jgi:hypothetical protein